MLQSGMFSPENAIAHKKKKKTRHISVHKT